MNPGRLKWRRIPTPAILPDVDAYQAEVPDGHLSVFVGHEPEGWHLSISHRKNTKGNRPGRYPSWDEIKQARYDLCPLDITMSMLLPPPEEFVNVHETTFHLWETP